MPLFTVFLFVALDAFYTLENSKYWKGSLHFRLNPQNGELFFSKENITYGSGDYTQLVLGCVRGGKVETVFMVDRKKSNALKKYTNFYAGTQSKRRMATAQSCRRLQ